MDPPTTLAPMCSTGAATPDAAGAQPAVDLGLLNSSSARVCAFYVRICDPKTVTYQYNDRSGNVKEGKRFSCLLLGEKNGSYCEGGVRGNVQQVAQAMAKYTDGALFLMSSAKLNSRTKAEWIGADVKAEVDLNGTKMAPVMQGTVAIPAHPTPRATCADISAVQGRRRFDIMAVLRSVSEPQSRIVGGREKKVVDVTIADGSKNGEKTCELGISVWAPGTALEPFAEAVGQAVLLRNLQAIKKDDQVTIATSDVTQLITPAAIPSMADDARFDSLAKQAGELQTLPAEDMSALTHKFTPGEGGRRWPFDVNEDRATLTCCALVEGMAEADALGDQEPVLLQLNDVRMEMPSGSVLTEKEDRIWFQTTLRDWSGATSVGVSEGAALQISGLQDKDEFSRQHNAGSIKVPLAMNVRVVRTVRDVPGNGPSQPAARAVSAVVVAGTEASVTLGPSQASGDLHEYIALCPPSSEGVLPACLADVKMCPFNGLSVAREEGPAKPCRSIYALVLSVEKSELLKVEAGYMVKTRKVRDAVPQKADGKCEEYVLSAFCPLEDLMDFKLDPTKVGGQVRPRMAEVIVTGVVDGEFTIEALRLVEKDQEEAAKDRYRRLEAHAWSQPNRKDGAEKRKVAWASPDKTPLNVKRCRTLTAWPSSPVPSQ